MKRLQIVQKPVCETFYIHEKILQTQNCCHKFIRNLYTEKWKENMKTRQPWFKSWLNKMVKIFGLIWACWLQSWATTFFFFSKIWLCKSLDVMVSYHVQYQKKLMMQSQENLVADWWMDRQTDRWTRVIS